MSPPFVTPFVCNSFCIPLRLCATGGGDRFCRLSASEIALRRHYFILRRIQLAETTTPVEGSLSR